MGVNRNRVGRFCEYRFVLSALSVGGLLFASAGPLHAGERVVMVGGDGRMDQAIAAERMGLSTRALEVMTSGTGTVECGGIRATAQLTGKADTITSAAHTFYDESGRSRAEGGRCVFRIAGQTYNITLKPYCGSTTPYAVAGHRDWAVAKLDRPVANARVYPVSGAPARGMQVMVVTGEGRSRTYDFCRIREVIGDAPREIRTDCTGVDGMSGAAYLSVGRNPAIVGIHVGFRSASPETTAGYSSKHYTFGTTVEAGFRKAVTASLDTRF